MHRLGNVNDFPVFQFHDDEDVGLDEEEGELNAEIKGPNNGSMVLEKSAPLLCYPGRLRLFHPVSVNRARRMFNAKEFFQHAGNSIAAVVRMIG